MQTIQFTSDGISARSLPENIGDSCKFDHLPGEWLFTQIFTVRDQICAKFKNLQDKGTIIYSVSMMQP